jgi:hypothetical protein
MASVLDQLPQSTLSLQGNNFNPSPSQPSWGYKSNIPNNPGGLEPDLSQLQYTYSVDGSPDVRIVDFNRAALGGVTRVTAPSRLDELDPNAPNNILAGHSGGVVSQIYKSKTGRRYRDLGPQPGRY